MNQLNLTGLNQNQIEAVKKYKGVRQILAVAGAGKTTVLTKNVAYMILNERINPRNILLATFSKKAADEMRERLVSIIGKNNAEQMTIGTFHGIAYKILRREYIRLQHPMKEAFAFDNEGNSGLLSDSKKKQYIQEAMKMLKMNTDEKAELNYHEILRSIGVAKNNLVGIKRFYEEAIDTEEFQIADVYKLYEERKKNEHKIDFDDMIVQLYELFNKYPEILKTYQQQYHYILVDEGQDNNKAQYELVKMLAAPHNNIMLVGDDDQSLYAFRGAKVKEFIHFQDTYQNLDIIKLEYNYRSTPGILEAANNVIKNNIHRMDKVMKPALLPKENDVEIAIYNNEEEESEVIAKKVKAYYDKGNKYKDCSVLFRTNAQIRAIEDQFIKNAIPYVVYGGKSFYEIKEIKDIIAYLELIVDKNNNKAFERVINVPTRYLGKVFMEDLKSTAKKYKLSLYNALKRVQMKPYQHRNVMNFMNLVTVLTNEYHNGSPLSELVNNLIEKTDYYSIIKLKTENEDDNDRIQNVETLLKAMSYYKTVKDFLDFIENVRNMNKKGADAVQMMTIHRSKGLEFKNVIIAGMSETLLPHRYALESGDPNSVEQERCLAYVGITRAKENLHMFGLTSFNGKAVEPSRFIKETNLLKEESVN